MLLKQSYAEVPNIKIAIPIGALMDIPTGGWEVGVRGEMLMNGGLGALTGIVGRPNRYKSLSMHYMSCTAMARIQEGLTGTGIETTKNTYDTEMNISERRLQAFAERNWIYKGVDLFRDQIWTLTDKTVMPGEEWFEHYRAYIKMKQENKSKLMVDTPFRSRDRVTPMRSIIPTFGQVDSLSAFGTSDVQEISEKHELGDSGANMIYARQGLAKKRLMAEMPTSAVGAQHFTLFTAHITDNTNYNSSPYAPTPAKQLEHMKATDKIKGVTPEFLFLVTNIWAAVHSSRLTNDGTKGPEYPRHPSDNEKFDVDLNEVTLQLWRSKNGPTGTNITLVVSQSEGVLPTLTEFHYLRSERKYWGMVGNNQNFAMALLPEVKLGRTTVRSKIDANPLLRRAINITAELSQLHQFVKAEEGFFPTAEQLYEKIGAMGYDWTQLLDTRGYWTFNQYTNPRMYLSTLDLVRMYHGEYHPFWLEDDKRTIKLEFMKLIEDARDQGLPTGAM